MEIAPEVLRSYASTIDESQRLTMSADGALELLRTQELPRRCPPTAPARVLWPTWGMLKATEQYTKESVAGGSGLFESALTAARMAEPYPELLSASSHMLALARRPA